MTSVPPTMRSLVAPKYGKPDVYEVMELPVPEIKEPDDILVKVYFGAIETGDTMVARGFTNFLSPVPLPFKLGLRGGGVVAAVGNNVKDLRPGDEVYGMHISHPVLPWSNVGYCSEYVVTKERLLLRKPSHLSFEDVLVVGAVVTAYQSFRRGLELAGPGSTLEGKTVLVPGALSAMGSVACQMLKNVYGVGKLISTVSTPKMPLVEQLMPGIVDQLIDYKTQDIVKEVGRGKVDFVYNTQLGIHRLLPVVNQETGVVMAIQGLVPKTETIRSVMGPENMPFWFAWLISLGQLVSVWLLRKSHIKAEFLSGNPGIREDVETAGEIIASGKLRASISTVVDLDDIEAVRRECGRVCTGKGGLGKLLIKIA